MTRWLYLACLCCSLSACGVVTEQSIYEGIRSNERAKSTGTDSNDKALPDYDQYRRERDGLKK
jgi:mannitol/fructose-specific phosphotransferase system IIA component (Ntr-type)